MWWQDAATDEWFHSFMCIWPEPGTELSASYPGRRVKIGDFQYPYNKGNYKSLSSCMNRSGTLVFNHRAASCCNCG